jgi:hypothetical protein
VFDYRKPSNESLCLLFLLLNVSNVLFVCCKHNYIGPYDKHFNREH